MSSTLKQFAIVMISVFVSALAVVHASEGETKDSPKKVQQVTLVRRAEATKGYGDSAYSFRLATRDPTKHKNYADIVFNNCGLLHMTPYGGASSRAVDLGDSDLKSAPDAAPEGTTQLTRSIKPVVSHVYLQEIDDSGETMTVKYRIDELTDDSVKLSWSTVKPHAGPEPDPRRGAAGTMGRCGGAHEQN